MKLLGGSYCEMLELPVELVGELLGVLVVSPILIAILLQFLQLFQFSL